MRHSGSPLAALPALMIGACLARSASLGEPAIEFNRDVRPILSENCFVCHGPGKEDRKANMRLDLRESALEHQAIVPGNPARSKIIQHIFSTDPKTVMPPPETNKKLAAAEKETLRAWIAAGAKYEPYWAYVKPVRPAPPPTKDPRWVQNPIDAFVLNELEQKGIKPSAEVDKPALLRRLSLDLVGLPPTPGEVSTFVSDTRPGSYERQVDRLLASPHFGERMAVPWLDLVRFADTVGYHGDQNINIFPYRDYVIESFNTTSPSTSSPSSNSPETCCPRPPRNANRHRLQPAQHGDPRRRSATKEYLAKYAADRVRTVSMAWLGSTMGCAECHDHKYDPFTSKDFYQMEAFFADIKQWGVYDDYGYSPNPELKGLGNDGPFPPEMEVDSPYLQRRIKKLEAKNEALYAQAAAKLGAEESLRKPFEQWVDSSLAFLGQHPGGWATPLPSVTMETDKPDPEVQTNFEVQPDGTVALGKGSRKGVQFTLPLSGQQMAAVRLVVVPREKAVEKAGEPPQREEASIRLSARLKTAEGDKATKLSFHYADAARKKEIYSNGSPIVGVTGDWSLSVQDGRQEAVWLLDKPIAAKAGDVLVLDAGSLPVASVRISVSPFAAPEPLDSGIGQPLEAALRGPRRDAAPEADLAARTYLLSTEWDPGLVAEARQTQRQIDQCRHGRAFTLVTVSRSEPRITRLLHRGDWQDQTGEILQPGVPHFLPQIPNPQGRRLTRLDLAQWLVSAENPLTARTTMNRMWKQFFGAGISAVVDDLGGQGEWPSHPELLDWLACEFMHPECRAGSLRGEAAPHDWDIKHMVKLMVMSSTYRQSSRARPDLKEIDPNNRLLARQMPRRLEAEFVRDNALFISGLLNEEIGGPSVHPYQPAGYYANLQFPDRVYQADQNEREYRRGVYIHWQRTFLHPMLANFDAPSREECTASRVVSNTPQQALTLLNDPTFVEAARVWAARLLEPAGESEEQRLDRAFRRAVARPPTEREKASLLEFLGIEANTYKQDPDDAAKLLQVGLAPAPKGENPEEVAAWTQLCRVILNLHETITCY